MGRLVLMLLAVIAVAAVSRSSRRPRLYGNTEDAFAFPTSDAHAGVGLDSPEVIAEWCRRLDCSEEQLRAATRVVGPSIEAVRAHLSRRR